MIRTVIIDDINAIRKKNIALIQSCCPGLVIVGEAASVQEGLSVIAATQPELLFLDIEMPDGTGFDLLQQLQPQTFKVIFVSGYDDYAIRAFRCSAVDYLLKPLKPEELQQAVAKIRPATTDHPGNLALSTLLSNLGLPYTEQKLVLKTSDKIYAVQVRDIVRCESDKNYTTFYFTDGRKLLVSATLKEYETILKTSGFFRTHQSHLINMACFDYYLKADGGNTIVLKNGDHVPLSTRKKELFLSELERH